MYTHLTFCDREELSRGLVEKKSLGKIADGLHRNKSSLSRELKRSESTKENYRAIHANAYAQIRAMVSKKPRKLENNEFLQEYVHSHLKLRWSPEQIARTLKKEYPHDRNMQISHESIYTYIYVRARGSLNKELLSYLRQKRKCRRKRGNSHCQKVVIPNMVSIKERPPEVADRTIPGHWEGDLIVGKSHKSAIGTLVERTTRTVILVPLKQKDAVSVREAFAKELKYLPKQMKLSLTYDRGKEMTEHELFTKNTKIQVYFADPYSPWQRGTNENTNGLLRQFFPKGTDLSKHSRKQIKRVQYLMNGRPRKVLDWQTPYEAFNKLVALRS